MNDLEITSDELTVKGGVFCSLLYDEHKIDFSDAFMYFDNDDLRNLIKICRLLAQRADEILHERWLNT